MRIMSKSNFYKEKAKNKALMPISNEKLLHELNTAETGEVQHNVDLAVNLMKLVDRPKELSDILKDYPAKVLRMLLHLTGVSQEQLATVVFHYTKTESLAAKMGKDEWYGMYNSYSSIEEGMKDDIYLRKGILSLFIQGYQWEEIPFTLERNKFNLRQNVKFWTDALSLDSGKTFFYNYIADNLKGRLSDLRSEHYIRHITSLLSANGIEYEVPKIDGLKCHYHLFIQPNILIRVTHQDTTSSTQDIQAENFRQDVEDLPQMNFIACIGGGGWERRPNALQTMIDSAYIVFGLNDFIDFITSVKSSKAA